MTEKKTITDERARQFYVHATAWDMCDNPKSSGSATARASLSREWDAWLAAHDARVLRDGVRGALDGLADIDRWDDLWDESGPLAGTIVHRIRTHRDTHCREED